MDGTHTAWTQPLEHKVGALIAVAILLAACAPLRAQSPKPFFPQHLSQPINFDAIELEAGELEAGDFDTGPRGQSVDDGPRLVRPPAHLIIADDQTVVVHRQPNSRSDDETKSVRVASSDSLDEKPNRPRTIEEALDRKGSITFRKTPLSEVVFLLSDLWQVNIVAGESVSGEVSGAFFDAPLREVLSAALTATGYSYRQTGNSLIVLPIAQVGMDDANFDSETILLPQGINGTDVEATIAAAQLLLGERGQLRHLGGGTVLVVDTAQRISRVRRLFAELSRSAPPATPMSTGDDTANPNTVVQNGIAYFSPQFTEAEQMAEPLREAMGENVLVAVYAEENRIMVKGDPQQLQMARDAIEQLDVPRQQVRITAMIYDVGLAELEQLGINYSRDLRAFANARDDVLENVTTNVDNIFRFTSDLTGNGLTSAGIRTINNNFEASVFLEALDATSEAKLLADPSITVADRNQASIRIVRKIPIVGANPVENSNAVFTQTEFEEAGVILNVKPRISRDGTIELQIQPEYSVVAEITATGPVIDSRTADTTVRVGNGQMFVLGGLRQKSIVESVRGVPYLKDIKYLGRLFRSHDTEVRESELIVFLKPELVTPYSPGKPREQKAGQVAECELDAIAHADTVPQTPCCEDPHCPNHSPRPRINGGSRSLGMHGDEIHIYQGNFPHTVIETTETLQAAPMPPRSNHEIDGGYPPVHIDRRFAPH